MSKQIYGFVVFVDPKILAAPRLPSNEDLEKVSSAIFHIKGVTAINPIHAPFDIYSVQAAATAELTDKLLASLL